MNVYDLSQKVSKLLETATQAGMPSYNHRSFGLPTQQKRQRAASPHNHGNGISKKRRKMAAASNRINRQRVKRWKH